MRSAMKTCTKCGETKELTEFHRNKRSKDGRGTRCKSCSKQYYQDSRERIREYQRNYWKNPRKFSRSHKNWLREMEARNNKAPSKPEEVRLYTMWARMIEKMPCYYCGTTSDEVLKWADYRIPVSRGGDSHWLNFVQTCQDCHYKKVVLTDAEFFGWED